MRRRLALQVAAAALAFGAAYPAGAQPALDVKLELPEPALRRTEGPLLTVLNAFLDSRSVELLSNGFPARITETVDLWQDRTWFDALLLTRSRVRIIQYEPLSKTYRVGHVARDTTIEEARLTTLDEVRRWVAQPFRFPITPPAGRRGLYYNASVVIETLNSNDLVEVQRWLSGDVRPAISGNKNPGSALVRGLRTLAARILGGDTKRIYKTSVRFDS